MLRRILPLVLVLCVLSAAPAADTATAPAERKKIAVIANYWDDNCRANLFAAKFFTGFPVDEGLLAPQVDVASIYIAQGQDDDMGHQFARKAGIKVYPTITEALTLGGAKHAVDGVLYIGQHTSRACTASECTRT